MGPAGKHTMAMMTTTISQDADGTILLAAGHPLPHLGLRIRRLQPGEINIGYLRIVIVHPRSTTLRHRGIMAWIGYGTSKGNGMTCGTEITGVVGFPMTKTDIIRPETKIELGRIDIEGTVEITMAGIGEPKRISITALTTTTMTVTTATIAARDAKMKITDQCHLALTPQVF